MLLDWKWCPPPLKSGILQRVFLKNYEYISKPLQQLGWGKRLSSVLKKTCYHQWRPWNRPVLALVTKITDIQTKKHPQPIYGKTKVQCLITRSSTQCLAATICPTWEVLLGMPSLGGLHVCQFVGRHLPIHLGSSSCNTLAPWPLQIRTQQYLG